MLLLIKPVLLISFLLLAAAELGDYDPRKHLYGYVSEFRIIASQTRDLESRIGELHQQMRGMSPAQCELNYLDKVKWHDMYGVDLHPVLVSSDTNSISLRPQHKIQRRIHSLFSSFFYHRRQGEDSVEYFLGLTPSGIVVVSHPSLPARLTLGVKPWRMLVLLQKCIRISQKHFYLKQNYFISLF